MMKRKKAKLELLSPLHQNNNPKVGRLFSDLQKSLSQTFNKVACNQ